MLPQEMCVRHESGLEMLAERWCGRKQGSNLSLATTVVIMCVLLWERPNLGTLEESGPKMRCLLWTMSLLSHLLSKKWKLYMRHMLCSTVSKNCFLDFINFACPGLPTQSAKLDCVVQGLWKPYKLQFNIEANFHILDRMDLVKPQMTRILHFTMKTRALQYKYGSSPSAAISAIFDVLKLLSFSEVTLLVTLLTKCYVKGEKK